ncbi:MAG: BMP family protein [Nitrospinota bacterium]
MSRISRYALPILMALALVLPTAATAQLKVAALLSGPITDASWNAAAYEGLKLAQKKHGIQFVYSETVKVADAEAAFRDYAAKGYQLVIGHSFPFGAMALKVAKDFPNTKFTATTSNVSAPNLASFDQKQHEPCFLAGVLAGLMTKNNVLGAIGGFNFPAIIRQVEAFRVGARLVNPKVRVFDTYISSWIDAGKAKEAALAQIDNGGDVIFSVTDIAGSGAIKAAQERKVWAIGSSNDQNSLAPDTVLTSALYDIPMLIDKMVEVVVKGSFEGKVYKLGMADGIGRLAPYHATAKAIPDKVKARIRELAKEIAKGKLVVPELTKEGEGKTFNLAKLRP